MLRKWEELPENLKIPQVKPYYDALNKKRFSLFLKRMLDVFLAILLIIASFPIMIVLAILIKLDSKGPAFYRQTRITQYGEEFGIFKFRSMFLGSDKGSQLTIGRDSRITKIGRFIRKYKLDEIGQLFDVLRGKMTFVGTRPEVPIYVNEYTPEMLATLLLPAGITSLASIYYKDENKLLDMADDADEMYIHVVLPDKMKYNLDSIMNFSLINDFKVMVKTFFAILGKEYSYKEPEESKVQK
jgi:lipopolysaccharide/colanic/teichoic acid biosynthesis glycosyltransferase